MTCAAGPVLAARWPQVQVQRVAVGVHPGYNTSRRRRLAAAAGLCHRLGHWALRVSLYHQVRVPSGRR